MVQVALAEQRQPAAVQLCFGAPLLAATAAHHDRVAEQLTLYTFSTYGTLFALRIGLSASDGANVLRGVEAGSVAQVAMQASLAVPGSGQAPSNSAPCSSCLVDRTILRTRCWSAGNRQAPIDYTSYGTCSITAIMCEDIDSR